MVVLIVLGVYMAVQGRKENNRFFTIRGYLILYAILLISLIVVVCGYVDPFGLRTFLLEDVFGMLGAPATLSTSVLSDVTVFGLSLFDLYDFLSSNLMLPLDGLLLSLFVGYVWSRSDALDALTNGGTMHNLACAKAILFLCRYVTPILIVIILLNGLKVF